jgi:hypothetical protein
MGFTAMTIDVGIIYHERRSLQNAADAAALAGASDLPPTANAATATAKALEWATNNGYVDGVDGTTMSVQTPYDLEDRNIHVKITRDTSFVFGRVLGLDTVNVTAEATAFLPSTRGVGGFAIITLDEHDCASLDKSGINNLFVNNGGAIMVNSDCDDQVPALNKVGSGDLIADGGIWYYKHGGWSKSGSGALEPEPVPLTPRMPDPMAGWAAPDVYSTPTSPDSGGTAPSPDTKKLNSGTHTLRPGVFWGGLSITSTADVTFEEGVCLRLQHIRPGEPLAERGRTVRRGQPAWRRQLLLHGSDERFLCPHASLAGSGLHRSHQLRRRRWRCDRRHLCPYGWGFPVGVRQPRCHSDRCQERQCHWLG